MLLVFSIILLTALNYSLNKVKKLVYIAVAYILPINLDLLTIRLSLRRVRIEDTNILNAEAVLDNKV